REVLLGGDQLRVTETQRRHEGGMDLSGRDDGPLELLVARGAGVVYDDALVAEVAGRAGPGVHAHVAHRAADHDLFDPVAVEDALQVGLAERVDVVLQDDRLALEVADLRVDLRPGRAGREERGVGRLELVPDVDHQVAGGTRRRQDLRRVVRGGLDPAECPFAAGEVVILDVDQDQRSLRHRRLSRRQPKRSPGLFYGDLTVQVSGILRPPRSLRPSPGSWTTCARSAVWKRGRRRLKSFPPRSRACPRRVPMPKWPGWRTTEKGSHPFSARLSPTQADGGVRP